LLSVRPVAAEKVAGSTKLMPDGSEMAVRAPNPWLVI
jgi:hypothetical protein